MAFGFGLPGAVLPGEPERFVIQHYRTVGSSAPETLEAGELAIGTDAVYAETAGLATLVLRGQAWTDAAYSPLAGSASIVTLGTIATGTWSATAIGATKGGTGLTGAAIGELIYGSGANTWARLSGETTTTRKFLRSVGVAGVATAPAWDTLQAGDIPDISATYQPLDSDLTAIAGLSSAGLVARTGSGTAAARTITGTANEITVTNGDGAAGNPTISLSVTVTASIAARAFIGF